MPSLTLRKRCAGLTLVELMVALSVSLLLAAGMVTILIQSRTSYKFQEALNNARAEGAAAIALLEQELRIAGYPAQSLDLSLGIGTASTANRLVVRYESPAAGHPTCGANTAGIVEADFAIGTVDGVSGLMCNNVIVAEGVNGLTVTYGLDSDGDGTPNGYGAVPAANLLRNVIAVGVTATVDVAYADLPDQTFSTVVPLRNQIR